MIVPNYQEIIKSQMGAIADSTPAILSIVSDGSGFSYELTLNPGYYFDRLNPSNIRDPLSKINEYSGLDKVTIISIPDIMEKLKTLIFIDSDYIDIANRRIKIHNINIEQKIKYNKIKELSKKMASLQIQIDVINTEILDEYKEYKNLSAEKEKLNKPVKRNKSLYQKIPETMKRNNMHTIRTKRYDLMEVIK